MKRNLATALAVAAMTLAAPALAQTTTPQSGQATTLGQPGGTPDAGAARGLADPSSDAAGKVTTLGEATTAASFAQLAASSGLFEVESGRLAMDKAANESVREFARMMVQDHTASNQRLTTLANAHGITVSPMPSGKQQQMLTQNRGLSGNEFDRQYLADQVVGHQETLRIYEQATAAADPGMTPFREFATQSLPMLRQHLQMAQSLAGSGVPTAKQ